MRSKKHIILLILGLAGIKLLITCVAGVLIFRGCGELIELSTRNSVYKDLGNNFEYRFSWPLIRDKSDSIWISPKVKNFMFNDKFIVAQQHYKGENSSANFDIKDPHCYSGDDTDTYYWIIDKQNVRRYGPMDYERFQNLCDSLNVGLSL